MEWDLLYFFVVCGFFLLLFGAEIMLRGAVGFADKLGISKLVVGMTIVAFGTSAPEFLVSLNAALSGSPAIAVGNLVGSNISNILLVTGISAFLMPILLEKKSFKSDGWILLLGTSLFFLLTFRLEISLFSGLLLLLFFVSFLFHSYFREKRRFNSQNVVSGHDDQGQSSNILTLLIYLVLGISGLVFGAQILVDGGVGLARKYGINEAAIGLTVMALGTSLPELAATVVAAIRKQSELALGNIVGSNIFNIVGIVGAVSIITPLSIPARVVSVDGWVMMAATIMLMPYMSGRWTRIGRFEGFLFLLIYLIYIISIFFGINSLIP